MEQFLSAIDEKQELLDKTADFLWDHPETAFTEYQSASYPQGYPSHFRGRPEKITIQNHRLVFGDIMG